jgi:ubiquinone/menaquinone biosynthesis C-methylase UbiE
MERRAPSRLLAEVAALARIEEMEEVMTTEAAAQKAAARTMWALGDYHRFATETVWGLGPVLVEACGIYAGQRFLDVAAGSGNVAIRAAEAGAQVVASDLTPENFEAGRREAARRGVELEWVEADAEALPFDDSEFDVVTSSLGAIFAPDHQAVADELLRVCRPGGTIGMINFTPEGLAGDFFALFGEYAPPPPPGALPPVMWGSEEHVRELFGDRVVSLHTTRREYVERAASPRAYCELFNQTFGPAVAIRAGLVDQPERAAAFDRDFLGYATRSNSGPPEGPAEYRYEYLLVVARKRGA